MTKYVAFHLSELGLLSRMGILIGLNGMLFLFWLFRDESLLFSVTSLGENHPSLS